MSLTVRCLFLVLALTLPSIAAAQTLADAQALFYDGQYQAAVTLTETLASDQDPLAVFELRTSAILFQLRRAIGEPKDKDKAFKACSVCPGLMTAFTGEWKAGQAAARTILKEDPKNTNALFFLGKLDLNYVWLVLGTLGRKTGWNEYWEARHSLDAVLVAEPQHVRGRVARAWIDYIVDTRMPWGTGWLLGGGNKKKALKVMQEAADSRGEFYANAEALFGLWDMHVREKNTDAAMVPALRLAELFPSNPEIARFVRTSGAP